MTEPKFSKGPWRRDDRKWGDKFQILGTKNDAGIDNDIPVCLVNYNLPNADANMALITASPEMYESEEKNLSMLKVILEGYEMMAGVVLSDPDAKAAIEGGTLARQLPCAMPDAIGEIIMELKMRITETETLLAKARGEENGK